MIFSSQLGKLDGLSDEQALKSISNHLRKMQEELEYRLAHLDSSNISEINADETNIFFAQGENINNIISDQEGRMSQFEQTVEGFKMTVSEYGKSVSQYEQTVEGFRTTVDNYENKVSEYEQTVDGFTTKVTDYEKGVSEYKQTVEGFTTQVSNYENQYSYWEQTVEGFTQQVSDYEKGYSVWTQTVEGFNQTVKDYEEGYSSWEQTVEGFTQQVSDYENKVSEYKQTVEGFNTTVRDYEEGYSSWEQTVKGFTQQVSDYETALSTTLKMDASGVYVTDQDGNTVTIQGSQIDARTINADEILVDNLYGEIIYLNYSEYNQYTGGYGYEDAGYFRVTGGTSAEYAIELFSYGALRMVARDGDAFVGSYDGYVTLSGAYGNTSQGNFFPSSTGDYSLGTSSYHWSEVYADTQEISTSDREKKNSIDYDTEVYGKLFDLLKPCSFKLNNGTGDRRHVGMISQDVEEALAAAGLTSKDFAGFVKSPRTGGNESEGGYDYALRYGEFIGMCIAEIQKLKTRVEELERKERDDEQAG